MACCPDDGIVCADWEMMVWGMSYHRKSTCNGWRGDAYGLSAAALRSNTWNNGNTGNLVLKQQHFIWSNVNIEYITQNKGKERENFYQKLKRSLEERHTQTQGNLFEYFDGYRHLSQSE